MHFSFVKSNKMYYPISTTIIDIYLLIWCGVTKYYLVLLKCLLLRNFFVFSTCSQTRGHQYKLFKKHNASRKGIIL